MKWDSVYSTRPDGDGIISAYGVPRFARKLFVRTLALLALALPVCIVLVTVLLVQAVMD